MEIMQYIEDNQLSYRLDASNDDTQIIRNKFRHEILPLLKEINPAANNSILQTIEHLRSAEAIMIDKIGEVKRDIFISQTEPYLIDIKELKKLNPIEGYLFELLRPFDFNSSQVSDIVKSLNAESGRSFYSNTHLLVKDRNKLIISSLLEDTSFLVEISEVDLPVNLPRGQKLAIKKIKIDNSFKIPTDGNVAAIDFDKLKFPLRLRGWEQGDYFFSFGNEQKKETE
jgi:tRNA(Ile)-lysidine synthase